MADGVLDEAYERILATGPERDGWLSNHAPMAAEALARHGRGDVVHKWLDGYADRLEPRPRGVSPIAAQQWRDPLGDPVRTGDWLDYFERELALAPWREVLTRWWPRLLPGIAAGATHGVIRVGHAVRALIDAETAPRVAELGHGLAYWAARWQPLAPPGRGAYPTSDPRTALDAVPRVPDQRYGIRARLAQLADLPDWPATAGAVPNLPAVSGAEPGSAAGSAPDRLAAIVAAAVARHATHGYANPVMLVHAATAPNAVLRALPALPERLWEPSLAAAWAATAAVTAAYSPAEPRPVPDPAGDTESCTDSVHDAEQAAELFEVAARTTDPHAIKFADTALDVYAATGDPTTLRRARHCVHLVATDS
ncbi:questin oxidase family protein [Solwaraspora sp. WMMA2056]|uniref:questin oxidase family protein n=1 Tax=Solwaraspora sp. WMMA2056 TaxID=3015161 RepID=UPI00259B939C|nr:questin oxidase family protein [Solwaraspora sp. WMMA2056]WJK40359.1 questin oxidase family protein [Solwaraspora sp. WMMA2056]